MRLKLLVLFSLLASVGPVPIVAQPPASQSPELAELADLSAAEYKALEEVTQDSVSATLRFLASDELGGRGTPSPGLDVAMAYAASRLQAAGAEGLGEAGSYYLPATIDTVQLPTAGISVTIDGVATLRTSVLAATDTAIDYTGKMPRVGEEDASELTGPAVVSAAAIEDQSPSRWLNRTAFRLRGLGATAMILEAPADSPLWEIATGRQASAWVPTPRANLALPIVLVEQGSLPEQISGKLAVPAVVKQASPVRNVAGIIRGSDPELADEAILFSAHVDHLGTGAPGDDPIYNGADDDASGVTAVLTLADAYGALDPKPKRSVIFVGFWGEEMGLLGSKHFVKNSPWPLEKIVANVNIEMIGRPEAGAENKMWVTGWDRSSLGPLMNAGSRRVGVETFEHPSYSARLYTASDNYSFVQEGVVAHSFSAGSLHEDYHQPSDEYEKMNLPHMTQVIRGVFAGSLPVAQGGVVEKR